MSSSLSSSSEFWEVDADRVEKTSSSHALCMLAAWKLLLRLQLDSDKGLVSLNKEFTCTNSPESRSSNGSNSQWSAGNATRDLSAERIPALAKHFLIVDSDTLSQAWAIHLIACSKYTDLHTSVAELQSSILLTSCVSISLIYLSLNAWIIPR